MQKFKWLNRAIFVWKADLLANFGLIIPSGSKPRSEKSGFGAKIKAFSAALLGKLLILSITFSGIWAIRPIAYAGLLDSMAGRIFNKTEAYVNPALFDDGSNSQTMTLLAAAVNFDPNPAKGGGDITTDGDALLPAVGPAGSLADVSQARPTSDQISIYIVREGDTLSKIAQMFGVSINTIRWANDISSRGTIRAGQVLTILPVDGVSYTVKKGDTLGSIAKKFKGDAEEIANYNVLAADEPLVPGTEIIIPDGVVTPPPAPRSSPTSALVRGAGGPLIAGYFAHPLPGGRKTQDLHGRNGKDFGAPSGTPIIASAAGSVIVARSGSWSGGYGNYVVINHDNGTQTLYAHMSSLATWRGAQVTQGQVIGYVGCTGRCTGPHLHFEVRGAANPF